MPTTTAPTATSTTNSVTVTNKQTDANSGISISKTKYAIRKTSDTSFGSWQSVATFTGLTHNTSYTVKTQVTDNAGNTIESATLAITTKTLTAGTLTMKLDSSTGSAYTSNTWTNHSIYVAIAGNGNAGTTTYESVSGSAQTVAVGTTAATTVTTENTTTLRVKTTDGTNTVYSSNYIVKIDKTVPVAGTLKMTVTDSTAPTITSASALTDKITFTATDVGTGIVGYAITTTNTAPTTFTSCTKTLSLTQTITGLTHNTTYYVWVKDLAGLVSASKAVSTKLLVAATLKMTVTDSTAPTITSASALTDKITFTATDVGTGIVGYAITTTNTAPTTFTSCTKTLALTQTITGLTQNTTYYLWVKDLVGLVSASKVVATQLLVAPKLKLTANVEKMVGLYADIDGNGSVDGVIFADLLRGAQGDGVWNTSGDNNYDAYGNYTIPGLASDAKTYEISQSSYSGSFGPAPVLKVSGNESGKDRFYVMALNDFNPGTYYHWYYSAYGNMSDYSTYTSGDFGTGKANTQAMIQKWNASGYGAQNASSYGYKDIWGQIQTEVQSGWFVPSRAEWAAFGEELSIANNNYVNFELSNWYWSSSQSDTIRAWDANFITGDMFDGTVYSYGSVRLATTF